MAERWQPKIEYNMAGVLPETLTPERLVKTYELLKIADFDGVCLFPFRSLTGDLDQLRWLDHIGLEVSRLEMPWNPHNERSFPVAVGKGLLSQIGRGLGRGSEAPVVQDALFPDRQTSKGLLTALADRYPRSRVTAYDYAHPGFPPDRLTLGVDSSQPGFDLCRFLGYLKLTPSVSSFFDPHNLDSHECLVASYPGNPTSKRADWERQFLLFVEAGRLDRVQIHPADKEDELSFWKGKGILAEVIQAAKEYCVEYWEIEMIAPLRWQIGTFTPNAREMSWRELGFFFESLVDRTKEIANIG